jgi:CRISPR-associated endonuclease/helicase Cas3
MRTKLKNKIHSIMSMKDISISYVSTHLFTENNIDSDNLFFLSSQVIPKHRGPRIDQIKNRRRPIVLVSTQVIETGVDLGFDILIRDIGPIDSIV